MCGERGGGDLCVWQCLEYRSVRRLCPRFFRPRIMVVASLQHACHAPPPAQEHELRLLHEHLRLAEGPGGLLDVDFGLHADVLDFSPADRPAELEALDADLFKGVPTARRLVAGHDDWALDLKA